MGMLSNNAMTAQNKPFNSIQWKIAAVLPATSGHAKAFGLAGAVCGIHQNALIIAGGANFPDAMPWLGGKKKKNSFISKSSIHCICGVDA